MLPFRSGRPRALAVASLLSLLAALSGAERSLVAQPSPQPSKSPGSFSTIPLPVGQEAKGLILPDFDLEGRMRLRLEAGAAKRIDPDHIQFSGMKMTTFTPESAVDLLIEMPSSILDLKTRVITSETRTSVQRIDFTIAGDRMRFDTIARKGTLTGNVKMVITDQSNLMKKPGE